MHCSLFNGESGAAALLGTHVRAMRVALVGAAKDRCSCGRAQVSRVAISGRPRDAH